MAVSVLCRRLISWANAFIRLPLIPNVNDTDDCLKKLCEFLVKNEGKYRYVEAMPYHLLGKGKAIGLGKKTQEFALPSKEDVLRWQEYFKKYNIELYVSE